MNNKKGRLIAALTAAALFLTACGGGGSDSEPAPTPTPDPDDGTGGITGTGVAVGPITGFGSVIVNGVTYDTSSATFTDDGVSAMQDDFAVGQFVLVTGTIDDSTSGTAETVTFDDNVDGPVTSVDDIARSLLVLGQTVFVSPTTSFDDSCPGSLGELTGVAAVEVSGPVRADGSIEATRIECKALAGELEVTGTVSNLDTGALTFQVNALVVDYSGATLDNFPSAGVINAGDPVEAKGTTIGANGQLVATRVEYKGGQFANDDGVHAEIEGFVTRFISLTDFDVSGIPATTTGSTIYEGGASTDLGQNLKIEIEGEFNASGILVATKIEFKQGTNIRVTGRIDAVSGNTVTVLNIPITTDSLVTRFEDKSDAGVDPLRVGNLNVDDYIEVRGQEFPAGSGEISAVLLERDDPRDRTELRGFVEAGGANRPTLTVLGVTINTDGATVYRNVSDQAVSADVFWAAVGEGSLVDARGTEVALSTILAEELQLEVE